MRGNPCKVEITLTQSQNRTHSWVVWFRCNFRSKQMCNSPRILEDPRLGMLLRFVSLLHHSTLRQLLQVMFTSTKQQKCHEFHMEPPFKTVGGHESPYKFPVHLSGPTFLSEARPCGFFRPRCCRERRLARVLLCCLIATQCLRSRVKPERSTGAASPGSSEGTGVEVHHTHTTT